MQSDYIWLMFAILADIISTSILRATNGFTRFIPSMIIVCGYFISSYCLSLSMKNIPVSIVYSIWSGAGIILITLISIILYNQIPDFAAIIGICLIIIGSIILNFFSKMTVY